jgi:hypothetical protein
MNRTLWKRAISNPLIVIGLLAIGSTSSAAWSQQGAATNAPENARPGTVNYVEGQAQIDGNLVDSKANGSVDVQPGQVLQTSDGKAEVLLTPGVFLRLDSNTEIRMVANGLTDTRIELASGKAMVEATDVLKGNDIKVLIGTAAATIDKNGLYEFSANPGQVMVYDGKATVENGDSHVNLGQGREVALTGKLKAKDFDTSLRDDLYTWSSVRSQYLSQAGIYSAQRYVVEPGSYGPGWWSGAGWYWNPWFSAYSFIPADGIFYSPFGWGFYSPWYVGYAPIVRFGYFGGFGYRGAPVIARVPAGRVIAGPGFRGSVGAFRGGAGFRGGFAGGFHGGGGFGGRH